MIIIAGAVIGGLWGARLARKQSGNRLDLAQYAGGLAILGAVIGLFITIYINRALI